MLNVDDLLAASKTAGALAEAFGRIPESEREAAEASLVMRLAELYLVEMANQLTDGKDAYDAALATARGEMKLPPGAERTLTVMQLLSAKPKR